MRLIDRLEPELSEDVVAALRKTLTRMDDGRPCPAPHVSVGSWAVASLAPAAAVRVLRGEPITPAPRMIFVNMSNLCTTQGIDLLAEIKDRLRHRHLPSRNASSLVCACIKQHTKPGGEHEPCERTLDLTNGRVWRASSPGSKLSVT
jgi:hypothetical protein